MWITGDGKKVNHEQMIELIANYIAKFPNDPYEITVGTDSQNTYDTKIIEVIAICRLGKGGIFFYNCEHVAKIQSLRTKIYEETSRSLKNAHGLLDKILDVLIDKDIDIEQLNIHFVVHCDIGYYGKTSALIKEIVGWVEAEGFECVIKPDSYTASGIANKFSK